MRRREGTDLDFYFKKAKKGHGDVRIYVHHYCRHFFTVTSADKSFCGLHFFFLQNTIFP